MASRPSTPPPDLSFTTVKRIKLKDAQLPSSEAWWNPLLFKLIREAAQTMTTDELRALLFINHAKGSKGNNGYLLRRASLRHGGRQRRAGRSSRVHKRQRSGHARRSALGANPAALAQSHSAEPGIRRPASSGTPS
jgi:hypothetical protein